MTKSGRNNNQSHCSFEEVLQDHILFVCWLGLTSIDFTTTACSSTSCSSYMESRNVSPHSLIPISHLFPKVSLLELLPYFNCWYLGKKKDASSRWVLMSWKVMTQQCIQYIFVYVWGSTSMQLERWLSERLLFFRALFPLCHVSNVLIFNFHNPHPLRLQICLIDLLSRMIPNI